MPYIGARLRRTEDPRLVRGEGQYVGDLDLPNALHAGFVRSPHAHARICSIDVSPALALPGVVAACTAADLGLDRPTPVPSSQPELKGHGMYPLAVDVVRYVGEPVVVVLAEDSQVLADAVTAVEVVYEPMEAIVEPEIALEGEALVWDDVPGNLALDTTLGFGEVEDAFERADVVVEARFEFARSAAAFLEARAVAAAPGGEDGVRVTLWDSTQAPHNVRRSLAQYFGLEEHEVRVITPDVGGSFGPKGRTYPEEYVATALALRQGVSVRWVSTRSEDLMTTGQGRGQIHHAAMAAAADGRILAIKDRLIQDAGAHTPSGVGVPFNTARHLMGPYRVPALSVEVAGVYTNKPLSSALRGGGRPEGIYVVERLLDRLAARLGRDRAEIRRRNFIPPEAFPYRTGLEVSGRPVVYDSGSFPTYLDRVLEAIGYESFRREQEEARQSRRYLGLGLAAFIESTGTGSEEATVEVQGDGRVFVAVGSPNTGQGHATTFAQIAAQRLGTDPTEVTFTSGDTGRVPYGVGTFASRMTLDGGNAVSQAALEVRRRALELAADLLEIAPHDLELAEGRITVRGLPERGISLAEVAQEALRRGEALHATQRFEPEHASAWAGGANAAIVEVDVETGHVSILRYVVVHDSGTLINPTLVEGQVHGGVAHGLGNAFYEACVYDSDGQPLAATFADYMIPGVGDVPKIEIIHVETPSPFNPEGIKGAGEGGTIAGIPTLVSAVEDALSPFGITIDGVPIRPEDIALALQRSQAPGDPLRTT